MALGCVTGRQVEDLRDQEKLGGVKLRLCWPGSRQSRVTIAWQGGKCRTARALREQHYSNGLGLRSREDASWGSFVVPNSEETTEARVPNRHPLRDAAGMGPSTAMHQRATQKVAETTIQEDRKLQSSKGSFRSSSAYAFLTDLAQHAQSSADLVTELPRARIWILPNTRLTSYAGRNPSGDRSGGLHWARGSQTPCKTVGHCHTPCYCCMRFLQHCRMAKLFWV